MKATEMTLKEMAEVIKDRWREKSSGGCRMLSEGGDCNCTLCLVGNLFAAAISNSNDKKEEDTIEERLHKALWAISGTDDLVPKVEKALRVALEMAYESGKAIRDEVLTNSSNDCVEAFIEELKK